MKALTIRVILVTKYYYENYNNITYTKDTKVILDNPPKRDTVMVLVGHHRGSFRSSLSDVGRESQYHFSRALAKLFLNVR